MLAGKTAVITGASSGLGRAFALALARKGGNLALFARREALLQETARLCAGSPAPPLVVPGDVTSPEDCRRLVERTVDRFGSVDYLILNAGIGMWAAFEDICDLTVFRRLMEVNYLGSVYPTHYALPHLRASRGMIVAISSLQGKIGVSLHTGYAASKHAVHGFFESLRAEVHGSGVDILLVLPSWVRGTELRRQALGAEGTPVGGAARKHNEEAVSVDRVCSLTLDAMRRRRRELVIPRRAKLLLWLNSLSPQAAAALIRQRIRRQKGITG